MKKAQVDTFIIGAIYILIKIISAVALISGVVFLFKKNTEQGVILIVSAVALIIAHVAIKYLIVLATMITAKLDDAPENGSSAVLNIILAVGSSFLIIRSIHGIIPHVISGLMIWAITGIIPLFVRLVFKLTSYKNYQIAYALHGVIIIALSFFLYTSFHGTGSNERLIKIYYPTLSDDAYNAILSHFEGEITSWPACNEYLASTTQKGLTQEDRVELASLTEKGINLLSARDQSLLEVEPISASRGFLLERERLLQKAIDDLPEADRSRWYEINTKALERGLLGATNETAGSTEMTTNSNQSTHSITGSAGSG